MGGRGRLERPRAPGRAHPPVRNSVGGVPRRRGEEPMKIVSVMTTTSRGGAEFAAVELLDALAARGHETVLLSDQPGIGRDTRVRVAPLSIGPKLSRSTYASMTLRWVPYVRRLRAALEREAPYDVLLLPYK